MTVVSDSREIIISNTVEHVRLLRLKDLITTCHELMALDI